MGAIGTELSIGARVGLFLAERKEQILASWVAAVRADPTHEASERLSEQDLRDNLSEVLDYLDETLWAAFDRQIKHGTKLTAAIHGKARWDQSYSIDEILRELSVLRALMIPHVSEFLESNPDLGGAARMFVSTTVHRYFDDIMRFSVGQYLADKFHSTEGLTPE